jgi:hypothetical protein
MMASQHLSPHRTERGLEIRRFRFQAYRFCLVKKAERKQDEAETGGIWAMQVKFKTAIEKVYREHDHHEGSHSDFLAFFKAPACAPR